MAKSSPRYNDTRKHILQRISQLMERGECKLPTERELSQEVLASYATVRLVMEQLEAEGFIVKIRGSGTYIRPQAQELLRQSQKRRLLFFHRPYANNPQRDYGCWLIEAAERVALQRGWKVESLQVRSHEEFFMQMRQRVTSEDSVLYLPPGGTLAVHHLGEFSRFVHFPVVVIDWEVGNINLANVTTDNRGGGMLAAREIISRGYRRLMVLLCEPHLRQLHSRVQGVCEIAEMMGVTPEVFDCHVGATDNREELTYRALTARLAQGNLPDAIFAISDSGAFGAHRAIEEFGLRVGEDIALVGFDGLAAGTQCTPSLATVVQPVEAICNQALHILENWDADNPPQYMLSPTFRKGQSLPPAAKEHTATAKGATSLLSSL